MRYRNQFTKKNNKPQINHGKGVQEDNDTYEDEGDETMP